jgi:hypothetical protein
MQNENFSDILARRLKSRGLDKAFFGAMVCGAANKVSGGEFEAISFKNGTLKISVSSGARAHLIKLNQDDIIAKINLELKKDLVMRLKFEIK